MSEQKKAETVDPVLSTDPKHDKNPLKSPVKPPDGKNAPDAPDESEEDRLLREKLETNAGKLIDGKGGKEKLKKALDILALEIRTATSSLTSVPKPLKFLSPFYKDLKKVYTDKVLSEKSSLKLMADVLSVMAMTMADEGSLEMLRYKLSGNIKDLGDVWGHEYVRALCGEISIEFQNTSADKEGLLNLAHLIVPFLMKQNTETEAVDLLLDVNDIKFLLNGFVDDSNCEKTCLYLLRFADYLKDPEILDVAFTLYLQNKDFPNALRIAMKVRNEEKISEVFQAVPSSEKLQLQQLGLILGGNKYFMYENNSDEVNNCIINDQIGKHFKSLARSLNMAPPKSPEDVYKTSVYGDEQGGRASGESAQENLASTYVNAFVNAGFDSDTLLGEENKKDNLQWVFRNKGYGQTAAIASYGLVHMWNKDEAPTELDAWLKPDADKKLIAGALLGIGISLSGLKDDYGQAKSLLEGYLKPEDENQDMYETEDDKMVIISGCLGLAMTYAGNPDDEAAEIITTHLEGANDFEVVAMASISLGLMYVGSGNLDVATDIVQPIMNLLSIGSDQYEQPLLRFIPLAIGLIFLGKRDSLSDLDVIMQLIESMENKTFIKLSKVIIEACVYTGSGDMAQISKFLDICSQHINADGLTQDEVAQELAEKEQKEAEEEEREFLQEQAEGDAAGETAETTPAAPVPPEQPPSPPPFNLNASADKEKAANKAIFQSFAVLGISLVAFGEDIGKEMSERTFQHLLQYGDLSIRRAVPLAMALSHISDPQYGLIDILKKLSNDADEKTQQSAIVALGLMSAGTTNSRVADFLRHTAYLHSTDAKMLLLTKLAQGLLFTGKGLMTLHPFHSDRTLMNVQSVAAILIFMVGCFDMSSTLLNDKYHILMFVLATAIRPRMLMTLKEKTDGSGELENVRVKVRIGQALETVGQAGNPKKITGFQTQETPVLLNVGDRVELATDEYLAYSSVLEGMVILQENENAKKE